MRKFDYINVVPFIDIMLVLLAIVLTTSTFIAKGVIPLNLPQAEVKNQPKVKSLTISIKKDGSIYLGKKEVTKEELYSSLENISRKSNITLRCDKDSKFQSFINAMEVFQNLGFKNVSIVTKK
jgi:biopolymer transport protein ExbD